jgi:hypothetical protein
MPGEPLPQDGGCRQKAEGQQRRGAAAACRPTSWPVPFAHLVAVAVVVVQRLLAHSEVLGRLEARQDGWPAKRQRRSDSG